MQPVSANSADSAALKPSRRPWRLLAGIIILAAIVLAAGLWYRYGRRTYTMEQRLQLQDLLMKSRDYKQALNMTDDLIGKNPDNAELLADRGIALFQLGRFDEARQAFEKTLAADPGNKQAKSYLDIMNTPNSQLLAPGDLVAQDDFEKALELRLPGQGLQFVQAAPRAFDEQSYSSYVSAEYTITAAPPDAVESFIAAQLDGNPSSYAYAKSPSAQGDSFSVRSPHQDIGLTFFPKAWPPKLIIDVSVRKP